ncbi:hypothetical protein [Weissella viridescens]|uniref:hypothetical protein n=1 Tax=Weissella viridescens TaxID=1629 RepID=UPI00163B606F|nr:hypothetical protein [Weissella viridescens]
MAGELNAPDEDIVANVERFCEMMQADAHGVYKGSTNYMNTKQRRHARGKY